MSDILTEFGLGGSAPVMVVEFTEVSPTGTYTFVAPKAGRYYVVVKGGAGSGARR